VGQKGITNLSKVDGLRRSKRKRLEPKWKKDYVNIRGGEQEKRQAKSESLPSLRIFYCITYFFLCF